MACGCVIITSDHLNAANIVREGIDGFIVPYGDVDAYLRRIEFLLKHDEIRKQMVSQSADTVQRFTWDHAVDRMEEMLEVLAGSPESESAAC